MGSSLRGIPALVMLVVACQPAAPPAGVSDADKAAIREHTASFVTAVNAKDWPTAAGHFSDDAILGPPNRSAVTGKANIQQWMADYPPFSNFTSEVVEIDGAGDIAFSRGTYEMDVTPPGATAPMHDRGKFIEVLKRQADGTWKVVRGIFNSDTPLSSPSA